MAICAHLKGSSTSNLLLVTTPQVPISVWRKLLFGDKGPTWMRWYKAKKWKVKTKQNKNRVFKAEVNFQTLANERYSSQLVRNSWKKEFWKKKKTALFFWRCVHFWTWRVPWLYMFIFSLYKSVVKNETCWQITSVWYLLSKLWTW